MTVPLEFRDVVRERANFACEYCGVSETTSGGELTIDHFQPRDSGGSDDLSNLVYCCFRCNLYKSNYWPTTPTDGVLWNPRAEPGTAHFLSLLDGSLHPISTIGSFSLQRLNLNRPALIAYRRRQWHLVDEARLFREIRSLRSVLKQMYDQNSQLAKTHQELLITQRMILALLKMKLS